MEPVVVLHPVAQQVVVEALDILGQGVADEGGFALLAGDGHVLVPVKLRKALGVGDDVGALVAVLGEGHGLLALVELEVPGLQGGGVLVHLVAGVVDVKLPGDLVARGLQHGGEGVPQHAAPGVADVHGAGGVGGDVLHQHPLALAGIAAAVGLAQAVDVLEHPGVKGGPVGEVEEARPGDLHLFEVGGGQVQVVYDGLGDLPGGGVEGPGAGHGGVAGPVAVGGVAGDLQDEFGQVRLGQLAGGHGLAQGVLHGLAELLGSLGNQL